MFTGIIQEIGQVTNLQKINNQEIRFVVDLKSLVEHKLQIGESVALNGSCHTIEKLDNSLATFFSSAETLDKTNLKFLKSKDLLNLELSVTPTTRMGGHFVSGHVDGLAKLLSISNQNDSYVLHFELHSSLSKFVVNKGSVSLNGISLTVAQKETPQSTVFSVAVIPHTWQNTTLASARVGDFLNCEVDMLVKYVQSLLAANQDQSQFSFGQSSSSQQLFNNHNQ